jgi:hypothetical protein
MQAKTHLSIIYTRHEGGCECNKNGFMSEYPFQEDDYVMHKHGDTQEFGKFIQIDQSKTQTMQNITKIRRGNNYPELRQTEDQTFERR